MDITRSAPSNDSSVLFDSTELDVGYLARLLGEPQRLGATPGWRAGWTDADAECCSSQLSSHKPTA
jgi:hypothetical protein